MSKRCNIAILADFPWSYFEHGATGRGGGQGCTWLPQLAEEFARVCPYQVHWITMDRGSAWGKSTTREWGGQCFHRIHGLNAWIDMRLGFRYTKWRLSRILRRIRPSLVHCWGTETAYPIVCGRISCPVILSMQGILTEYARIGSLPKTHYWEELVKRESGYLNAATVVTCESQWGIDRILEVNPGCKTYQVEYGVHPGFFDLAWTPDSKAPYALFSGSIDNRKGVDILLEAMETLPVRTWRLKLAGHGSLYHELAGRSIPGVEWLGTLNWAGLRRELQAATCLVLPTRADTSPNVVKEARVIGLPVITSIHGGQAGYIRDGENGIIVEPLDAKGLAGALARVMDDPQLARRMGATRHAEDRAYFRSENTARGFLKIYNELLS